MPSTCAVASACISPVGSGGGGYDDEFWIEDLNSLNGTRVNGAAISSRQKLIDKDQINVGDTILTFAIESN